MVKFVTNASSATLWPKLEPMLLHYMLAKFGTNSGDLTWWSNLEPMQVALYLAGEITQVIDSIPGVRCASGNVLHFSWKFDCPFVLHLFFCCLS